MFNKTVIFLSYFKNSSSLFGYIVAWSKSQALKCYFEIAIPFDFSVCKITVCDTRASLMIGSEGLTSQGLLVLESPV